MRGSISAQYVGPVPVNDVNTVLAPGYSLLGIDGGYALDAGRARISAFLRLNNLLDRSALVDCGRSVRPKSGSSRRPPVPPRCT